MTDNVPATTTGHHTGNHITDLPHQSDDETPSPPAQREAQTYQQIIQEAANKIAALNLALERAHTINIKHVQTMDNLKKLLKTLDAGNLSHVDVDKVITERNHIRSHIRTIAGERNALKTPASQCLSIHSKAGL